MATSEKSAAPHHHRSHFTEREETFLFWMKLLAIFLFLNIVLYSLQLASQLSGCALAPGSGRTPARTALAPRSPADGKLTEYRKIDEARFPTTPEYATDTRRVKVLAVIDSWGQLMQPQWRETVPQAIDAVSRFYHQKFGITFDLVGIRAWDSGQTLTMPNELAALKRAYPITTDYDVVIGVTGASGLMVAGIAEVLGNHLIVAATPLHRLTDLLAHELGHIFGARDTAVGAAIQLFAGPFASATLPDSFAVAIRQYKWRSFRLPPASPPGTNSFLPPGKR